MRVRTTTEPQFITTTVTTSARAKPSCDDPLYQSIASALASDENTVHIERALDPSLFAECTKVASARPFRREIFVASGQTSFEGLFDENFSAECRMSLQADFARWTALFCALTEQPRCKATLAAVWTDSCRKFHADFVPLRALCTYAGPGTEFVHDANVRRDVELDTSRSIEAIARANAQMIVDPKSVRRAAVGDLLLLKGELWPKQRGRGAMHRSPPIEESSTRRLVLALNVIAPTVDRPSDGALAHVHSHHHADRQQR